MNILGIGRDKSQSAYFFPEQYGNTKQRRRRTPGWVYPMVARVALVAPPGGVVLEICPRGNNKCSYYYIFVFMINVYIHAIIVLTGNINTCVICKLIRVHSKASL